MIRDQVDGREEAAGARVPAGGADGLGVPASPVAVEGVDVEVDIYGEAELGRGKMGVRPAGVRSKITTGTDGGKGPRGASGFRFRVVR
jgi:hypothetical protein